MKMGQLKKNIYYEICIIFSASINLQNSRLSVFVFEKLISLRQSGLNMVG